MRRDYLTAAVVLSLAVVFGGSELKAGLISPTNGVNGSPTNPFFESACPKGDAGDSFSTACVVRGGPYDGFVGSIGGFSNSTAFYAEELTLIPFDGMDVFAFHWITAAPFVTLLTDSSIGLNLFFQPSGGLVPGDLEPSGSGINIANLLSGDYFLVLQAFVDPPFSISIFGPKTNPLNIGASSSVPEPALLLLLGAGLTAAVRRRRDRGRAR